MASLLRAHPVALFAVLACLFGWPLHIAYLLGARVQPNNNPIGPILAALVTAAVLGRPGLKAWGRQLLTFRASAGWYVLALLAPAAVITAAVLANRALGAPLPTTAQLSGWTSIPGDFAATLFLVGIGEEAGWTAFAAPRLLSGRNIPATWLILSAIRVLWHLPLMLAGLLPWVLGVGGNIAFQLLLLWIFVRSGGVWFLAAIWHSMLNALGGQFFFRLVQGEDQARLGVLMTLGYVLLAAVVLLADFRRLAHRPRPA